MINEYPVVDSEYMEGTIKSVREEEDCYEIHYDMTFILYKKYGVVPKVGDHVRLYTYCFSGIRGIFLNGKKLFYKTLEEQQVINTRLAEEQRRKRKEEFETQRLEYEQRIEALPDVFKNRMKKFQIANPEFDAEYGLYELFCCEQAVLVANALKTEKAITDWYKLPFDEQKNIVLGWSDGHSGNTAGCSASLAKIYVSQPEFITKMHGALTPLVGCKEYGCEHNV